MNRIKTTVVSVKNAVVNNRGKIAVVMTAATAAAVANQIRVAKYTDEFLKEHDLLDEYYADPTEIES